MSNPEQKLADLEKDWLDKKRAVTSARAKLRFEMSLRRLQIKANNITLDRGAKLGPSDISAQLTVECHRDPLLARCLAVSEAEAARDMARVRYSSAKDAYWSERHP